VFSEEVVPVGEPPRVVTFSYCTDSKVWSSESGQLLMDRTLA
jgi:hypothetical protein